MTTGPNLNGVPVADLLRAIGKSGLSLWAGRIDEEYLTIFSNWDRAAKTYREMADDVTVGTLLDAIQIPIMASPFDVIPGGDTDTDRLAAEFVMDNLTHMRNQTWINHVEEVLTVHQYGWSVSEMVFEKREDGRIWIRNIDLRGQETLEKWHFDEEGSAEFMQQRDPNSGKLLEPIPLSKCIHIVIKGRKKNPQGKSLLRSIYRPWRMMKDFENLEGIGVERDVGGTPTVEYTEPELFKGLDQTQLQTIFGEALENLRVDALQHIIPPPGAKIVPYQGVSKAFNVREIIKDKQKEILMRYFAQFLALGMDNVGTQALVEGSQDFFSIVLRGGQVAPLEAWNGQLIPLLMSLNPGRFGGRTADPIITWNLPGAADIAALTNLFSMGSSSGLITITREDEVNVRQAAGLPELPEGEGEGPRGPGSGTIFNPNAPVVGQ